MGERVKTLRALETLAVGSYVRLGDDTGTLVLSNACRAVVELDRVRMESFTVHDKDGAPKTVTVRRQVVKEVSPATEVELLGEPA